ncbi:MAG: hypothetical protein OEY44_01050 [Candidatus Peregrinibacteria bacterium]|nr:hypothetical protein [Candidatus Peregrinibacteria bacterium]
MKSALYQSAKRFISGLTASLLILSNIVPALAAGTIEDKYTIDTNDDDNVVTLELSPNNAVLQYIKTANLLKLNNLSGDTTITALSPGSDIGVQSSNNIDLLSSNQINLTSGLLNFIGSDIDIVSGSEIDLAAADQIDLSAKLITIDTDNLGAQVRQEVEIEAGSKVKFISTGQDSIFGTETSEADDVTAYFGANNTSGTHKGDAVFAASHDLSIGAQNVTALASHLATFGSTGQYALFGNNSDLPTGTYTQLVSTNADVNGTGNLIIGADDSIIMGTVAPQSTTQITKRVLTNTAPGYRDHTLIDINGDGAMALSPVTNQNLVATTEGGTGNIDLASGNEVNVSAYDNFNLAAAQDNIQISGNDSAFVAWGNSMVLGALTPAAGPNANNRTKVRIASANPGAGRATMEIFADDQLDLETSTGPINVMPGLNQDLNMTTTGTGDAYIYSEDNVQLGAANQLWGTGVETAMLGLNSSTFGTLGGKTSYFGTVSNQGGSATANLIASNSGTSGEAHINIAAQNDINQLFMGQSTSTYVDPNGGYNLLSTMGGIGMYFNPVLDTSFNVTTTGTGSVEVNSGNDINLESLNNIELETRNIHLEADDNIFAITDDFVVNATGDIDMNSDLKTAIHSIGTMNIGSATTSIFGTSANSASEGLTYISSVNSGGGEGNVRVYAQDNIDMSTTKGSIALQSTGNAIISSTAGEVQLNAATELDLTADEIEMDAVNGIDMAANTNINASANQDITLEATNDLTLYGIAEAVVVSEGMAVLGTSANDVDDHYAIMTSINNGTGKGITLIEADDDIILETKKGDIDMIASNQMDIEAAQGLFMNSGTYADIQAGTDLILGAANTAEITAGTGIDLVTYNGSDIRFSNNGGQSYYSLFDALSTFNFNPQTNQNFSATTLGTGQINFNGAGGTNITGGDHVTVTTPGDQALFGAISADTFTATAKLTATNTGSGSGNVEVYADDNVDIDAVAGNFSAVAGNHADLSGREVHIDGTDAVHLQTEGHLQLTGNSIQFDSASPLSFNSTDLNLGATEIATITGDDRIDLITDGGVVRISNDNGQTFQVLSGGTGGGSSFTLDGTHSVTDFGVTASNDIALSASNSLSLTTAGVFTMGSLGTLAQMGVGAGSTADAQFVIGASNTGSGAADILATAKTDISFDAVEGDVNLTANSSGGAINLESFGDINLGANSGVTQNLNAYSDQITFAATSGLSMVSGGSFEIGTEGTEGFIGVDTFSDTTNASLDIAAYNAGQGTASVNIDADDTIKLTTDTGGDILVSNDGGTNYASIFDLADIGGTHNVMELIVNSDMGIYFDTKLGAFSVVGSGLNFNTTGATIINTSGNVAQFSLNADDINTAQMSITATNSNADPTAKANIFISADDELSLSSGTASISSGATSINGGLWSISEDINDPAAGIASFNLPEFTVNAANAIMFNSDTYGEFKVAGMGITMAGNTGITTITGTNALDMAGGNWSISDDAIAGSATFALPSFSATATNSAALTASGNGLTINGTTGHTEITSDRVDVIAVTELGLDGDLIEMTGTSGIDLIGADWSIRDGQTTGSATFALPSFSATATNSAALTASGNGLTINGTTGHTEITSDRVDVIAVTELGLDGNVIEMYGANGISLTTDADYDVTVTIGTKVISVEAMYDALVLAGML